MKKKQTQRTRPKPRLLWNGDEILDRERFEFTPEEANIIHGAVTDHLRQAIQHPYGTEQDQRDYKNAIALILSKIDGRLRPMQL